MFTRTEPTSIVSFPLPTSISVWLSSNGTPTVWDIEMSTFGSIMDGSNLPDYGEKITYNTHGTESKIVFARKNSSVEYAVIESPLY